MGNRYSVTDSSNGFYPDVNYTGKSGIIKPDQLEPRYSGFFSVVVQCNNLASLTAGKWRMIS
jgi:hypothetical protein